MISSGVYAQHTDTIYLHNGQLLVGEFLKLEDGRFEFDVNDAGVVKIKYDKVQTLKAISHIYRISTLNRKIYYGQIEGKQGDGYIRISSGDSITLLKFKTITEIGFFDKPSFKTFNGYVSAGYSYTRSSGVGRLNLDGLISFQLKKWESTLSFSSIITYTDSVWSRDRDNVALTLYYYLSEPLQLASMLNYQRNIELGLARRFQQGLGLRYKVVNKINVKVKVLSGLLVNQEKNLEGESFPTRVEWPVNLAVDVFRFSKPEISLNVQQAVYMSLSQQGRIRQDGEIRLNWELINDLSLSLQFYHSYDNKPVLAGSRTLDYGTVIGIKYDLGKY